MEYSSYYINNKGELCITYSYLSKAFKDIEYTYLVNGVAKNAANDIFLTICR